MRRASIALTMVLLLAPSFGQQNGNTVTVAGCVLNANGNFRLHTTTQNYILKGHRNELFSYNGKLIEVSGTTETPQSSAQGVPIVLHITKIKKLADYCQ